jgi:iron(III) transport system ATP-binding protein
MSADLVVTHLEKRFAALARPAVDDVSFTVATGEILVLLGPSGCGKTTTLRMVAGLEKPTAGEIAIGGRTVVRVSTGEFVPPQHREIGMVFQSYAVWPHMTVFDNIAYPLRRRGFDKPRLRERVHETLAIVGLEDYAARQVDALSGGQMQRVALARSLAYRPRLLLLDEPLSNLDAKLRLRLRDELRRIIKAAGVTALYVTHDQSEAVVLGDRIGVMQDGVLVQMSAPVDLYNRPESLFVANFTGVSNFLKGSIASSPGTVRLADGAELRVEPALSGTPGEPVIVALRPENISLHAGHETIEGVNAFPARVAEEHFQGSHTIYVVEALGARVQAVEMGTVPRFSVGEPIRIVIPPKLSWVFPDTGMPDGGPAAAIAAGDAEY